jgi:hypothetical protein
MRYLMRVIVPCCVPPYESRTKPALDSSCLGRVHTHDCRFIDFQKASTQVCKTLHNEHSLEGTEYALLNCQILSTA